MPQYDCPGTPEAAVNCVGASEGELGSGGDPNHDGSSFKQLSSCGGPSLTVGYGSSQRIFHFDAQDRLVSVRLIVSDDTPDDDCNNEYVYGQDCTSQGKGVELCPPDEDPGAE